MQGKAAKAALTLLAIAALFWLVDLYSAGLRNPRYFDGWVLLIVMAVQVAFRIRRTFPARAWGRVSTWMQMHLYLGYFAIGAFVLHSEFSWPDSRFGWLLWGLFLLVTTTGMLGAYLSAVMPARLQTGVAPILFDELAGLRGRLAAEAEALVAQSVAAAELQSLSDLYTGKLHFYFSRPRNVLSHLRAQRGPLRRLCAQLDNLHRLAGDDARASVGAVKNLVIAKDRLDFQFANEGAMRLWLFIHIPATYCLVAASILHVVVAYAYTSGVP